MHAKMRVSVEEVLADALEKLDTDPGAYPMTTFWHSFPEQWGSTALGFGGLAGQAFTEAQTIVVFDDMYYRAAVYWAGRFAYTIDKANPKFEEWIEKFHSGSTMSKYLLGMDEPNVR